MSKVLNSQDYPKIVTYHDQPTIDCGQYDITNDGVYIDGALLDKEFMRSSAFFLRCESADQAQLVRELIEKA